MYIVYINCCLIVCYLQEWIDHALKNAPLLSIYMWLCLCCCIVSNLHKIKSFSHSWKLFGCTLQGKFCTVWAFPRVVYLKSQDAAATWESSLFWRDFLGEKTRPLWVWRSFSACLPLERTRLADQLAAAGDDCRPTVTTPCPEREGGKLEEKKSQRVGSQFKKEGATADVQYCIVHTCASSSLKSLILDSLDELTSAGSRRLRSASSEAYLRT